MAKLPPSSQTTENKTIKKKPKKSKKSKATGTKVVENKPYTAKGFPNVELPRSFNNAISREDCRDMDLELEAALQSQKFMEIALTFQRLRSAISAG